jgi:hypothetical protein
VENEPTPEISIPPQIPHLKCDDQKKKSVDVPDFLSRFPTTLYAFVDPGILFSCIIALVMFGKECKLRRLSVCSARTSITFPVFVTRLDFIALLKSAMPRSLRRRSAAARLLRSWVQIQPGAWMFVCCECCVLSGRGLCDELIARPEESYRLW